VATRFTVKRVLSRLALVLVLGLILSVGSSAVHAAPPTSEVFPVPGGATTAQCHDEGICDGHGGFACSGSDEIAAFVLPFCSLAQAVSGLSNVISRGTSVVRAGPDSFNSGCVSVTGGPCVTPCRDGTFSSETGSGTCLKPRWGGLRSDGT
jgi:hypothetical protein